MYACLYAPQAASLVADQQALFALAEAFSPEVEQTSADTVLFSVAPLRALMGSIPQSSLKSPAKATPANCARIWR